MTRTNRGANTSIGAVGRGRLGRLISVTEKIASYPQESFLCPLGCAWVVYYPLADKLLILNETAKVVWDLLSQGCEAPEITSALAGHFGIPEKQAAQDVAQLLADLTDCPTGCDGEKTDACEAYSLKPQECTVNRNASVDCGTFRFGKSKIRILSVTKELDESFFLRFQHRAIDDDGADVLEISAGDSSYRLTFRNRTIAQATTITRTMSHLVEFLLAQEHPHKPLLAYCHAAAVSHRGRAVLMPGNSGVGKSTLTGFLVAHDFSYLGDDMIAIGEDAMSLFPLPTCLSIKAGSWALLEPFYPALPKLATLNRYGRSARYIDPPGNYEVLSSAAVPAAIVFPAFSEGAATRLAPWQPHQTMIRLLEANVRLSGWGAATEDQLARFVHFVEQTPAYELSYSELPEAMKAIEELLGSQP